MFDDEINFLDDMDAEMSRIGVDEAIKNIGHSCRNCIINITNEQFNEYNGCCSNSCQNELKEMHDELMEYYKTSK